MNHKTIKLALFAALLLVSLSCFVYINTTPIDRALSVETPIQPVKTGAVQEETNSKMPDLAFVKGVVNLLQRFLPAK